MSEEDDFQIVITGKFIQCLACGATPKDGTYASFTTRRMDDGRVWITPHRTGCAWSDKAGSGLVSNTLALSLYEGMN